MADILAVWDEYRAQSWAMMIQEADASCSRGKFFTRDCCKIDEMLYEQRKGTAKLYNLYLDKCYGESKTSLGEWMNFSTEDD